jgi:hypothetical protein
MKKAAVFERKNKLVPPVFLPELLYCLLQYRVEGGFPFLKLEPGEGIKLRLDDKLSRILHNQGDIRKNDVADLMGYLALLAVA